FFERGNLFADRRLPCPKLARNRRKAPAIDDAHEYLDAFEPIHPILLREMLRRSGMTRTFNTPQSGRSRAAEMGHLRPYGSVVRDVRRRSPSRALIGQLRPLERSSQFCRVGM